MLFETYSILNFFLACGITFHSTSGSYLENRKQIYDKFISLNKFEGEWIDPHSLGIFDDVLEFEDPHIVQNEEIYKKVETRKNPASFSDHRILRENKLQDGFNIGRIFETGNNLIFSLGKNLVTVTLIFFFAVFILLRFFPKTVIIWFMFLLTTFWHWMKLYQEKIAEKQNLTENLRHPNECHRGELHWYEGIYLYLSSFVSPPTNCKEYYKAHLVDPFWEVSLPMAMMNAFTSTICEPMKVFATTVRFCFAAIFSGLTLLELSISLFAIFITFLMWHRYSFSLCWGAITLYPPKSAVDQNASLSVLCWGTIKKMLKSLFFRESAQVLSIPPNNKKAELCYKDDKMKVLETTDGFQKQENGKQILFFRESPPKLSILPNNKKVELCLKDDEIKVSETTDGFQKPEKRTENLRQIATLKSRSLLSEKNKVFYRKSFHKHNKKFYKPSSYKSNAERIFLEYVRTCLSEMSRKGKEKNLSKEV